MPTKTKTDSKKTPTTLQPAKKSAAHELAPIQELIADEIGELIMRGGDDEDVTSILWSALANMERKVFARFTKDGKAVEARVAQAVRATLDRRKAELVMAWKQSATPGEEETTSKAAHLRIRALVIETLRERFETFIVEGTPEEHYLMTEILLDHEMSNHGREMVNELAIGTAFERQLGIVTAYIRVPAGIQEQVQRYIDCLMAAPCKTE